MRGAIDLGALRSASTATAQRPASAAGPSQPADGAGASPTGASVVSIDVTEATFQTEVIERSMTVPVVIDFWADWCQPCRQLTPVLERLVREGNGSWVLAKVDIEANPRLAAAFRVQGIPLVYAIFGGQPVDAFNGVPPEAHLREWIDGVLQAAGVEADAPEDTRMTVADDALADGDLDAAEQAYKKILAESPADAAAESGLSQIALLRRTEGIDPDAALAAAAEAPDDVAAQQLAADVEVLSGGADKAYKRLVNLIRRTSGDEREAVRKHLVSLFSMAGPDDPAVAAARRSLASALF
jgi:putative thioredoxin